MLFRRLSQGVLASLAAGAVLTFASAARAVTTITPNVASITRTTTLRTDPVTALWLSRADCLANDVLTFPITATGYVGSLQVWASNGADCTPPEARNSSVAQCWEVFSGTFTNTVASIPIRVQDIAAMKKPPQFPHSVGDETSCTPAAGTASSAQPISLFFMDVLGDQNQGGSSWATKLDLVGPAPPTSVTTTLGIGNTLLIPTWTATGDIDVAGYDFFCKSVAAAATPVTVFGAGSADAGVAAEAASSTSTVVTCTDASTTTDAGTDDGAVDDGAASDAADDQLCTTTTTPTTTATVDASPSASCGSVSAFGVGAPPTADDLAHSLCGSIAGVQATTFTITGLTNFTQYEVAIGSVDAVGNIGPLASEGCAIPQPVKGFAENYRDAGGTAGGGFCAMGRVPSSSSPGLMGSLVGVGIWLGRRRKRPAPSCHTV